ncbi:hypothetical protein [Sphingobium sp. CECT 9361]|uniref:hypothetical protein n=1 Tax=Sphingobium sp. CECT 9361 TaxID=2845384 RepID=UPI001E3BD1CE|nr:hypothetical protein [Sphingobium sp. CECT 9361]CAH0349657.1 hypothetical protein SPH9361_00716 [Sphingobium sp. CECT 9361]
MIETASIRRASPRRVVGTAALMAILSWAVVVSYPGNVSPFGVSVLDSRQLRNRALRARQDGRADAANLVHLSARLGWRDSQIQYWLLEEALQKQDYRSAVERIDAVLRRKPVQAARLFPILHALVMDAEGRDALLGRFRDAPPWRLAFLQDVTKLDGNAANGHEALLDGMIVGGIASARDEVLPYVRRLLVLGEYGHAKDLWSRAIRDRSTPDNLAGTLAEIDTSLSDDRISPFEWRARRVAGAELRAEAVGVRIIMDGSTFGTLAERTLVLKPGTYRISVGNSNRSAFRDGRIGWSLSCLPGRGKLPLRSMDGQFAIPTSSCPAQQISLNARRAVQSAPADIILSSVRIVPVAMSPMSPSK